MIGHHKRQIPNRSWTSQPIPGPKVEIEDGSEPFSASLRGDLEEVESKYYVCSQAETSSFFEFSEIIFKGVNHKIDNNEPAAAEGTAESVALSPPKEAANARALVEPWTCGWS